ELHVLAGVRRDVDARLVLDVLVGGARMVAARVPADAASRAGRDAGADRLGLAILHVDGPVLLGVEVDLLGASLVLEAELVEVVRCAADGRPALDAGLRAVRRERVGRHLLGVVHAPGDDGLIRIAFEERDDHFLADARDRHDAPVLAGPVLRDPDPARTVLVPLSLAIPVKLHLHAAVLVDEDLLPGGADHLGRLHAVHDRAGRRASGSERRGDLDARELVLIRDVGLLIAGGVVLAGTVLHARDDIASVERAPHAAARPMGGDLVSRG